MYRNTKYDEAASAATVKAVVLRPGSRLVRELLMVKKLEVEPGSGGMIVKVKLLVEVDESPVANVLFSPGL